MQFHLLGSSYTFYLTCNVAYFKRIAKYFMVWVARGNLHNTCIQSYNITVTSELTDLNAVEEYWHKTKLAFSSQNITRQSMTCNTAYLNISKLPYTLWTSRSILPENLNMSWQTFNRHYTLIFHLWIDQSIYALITRTILYFHE